MQCYGFLSKIQALYVPLHPGWRQRTTHWQIARLDIFCNILYSYGIQWFPRRAFPGFSFTRHESPEQFGWKRACPAGCRDAVFDVGVKQHNTIGIRMKNKFTITLAEDGQQLLISEHAEVDKDIYSLLCEERFDRKEIESVAADTSEALVAALRTVNFFPPLEYANQISAGVKRLLDDSSQSRVEVLVDDRVVMKEAEEALAAAEAGDDADEDADGLDHLLKDEEPVKPTMDATKEESAGAKEDN